jgi:HAE1 family hydrophobic/amphiphilic exporter-1
MIGVTAFGLIFTPVFYVMSSWLGERASRRKAAAAAAAHPAE